MIARAMALILLILPGVAEAQFSANVTQIGLGSPTDDDPAYPGVCAEDACRATIPLLFGNDLCVLNLRVGAPSIEGWGQIRLAMGPCRSGRVRSLSADRSLARYHLDSFGATSIVLTLPIQPPQWNGIEGLDDGVLRHADAAVRVDIIATEKH